MGEPARAEGPRSIAVAGAADGSLLLTGDHNTVVQLRVTGDNDALIERLAAGWTWADRARPTPVLARPAPFPAHVDREEETARLLELAATASPVNLHGEADIGKTYVLVHAANRPEVATALPDGAVFLAGGDCAVGSHELLQSLFEEFYSCDRSHIPSPNELRRHLRDKAAFVFVDDFRLDEDDAQRFFLAASNCRFVVASRERTVWDGSSLLLRGLAPGPALAIVERELQRPLQASERAAAEAICAAVGGNPRAIRRAVAPAKEDGVPLDELAGRLAAADPTRALLDLTLESATPDERRVLPTLAAVAPASLGTEHVSAISGVDRVQLVLDRLERRQWATSSSPRYRLVGVGPDDLDGIFDLQAGTARAAEHLADWAEARPGDVDTLAEAGAVLAVLRSSVRRGLHREAIRLGRAASAAFALGRRWDGWQQVLGTVLDAARRVGDRDAEAWALHQLGTRAICLDEPREGVESLRAALRIRKAIGDRRGAAATRHNLAQARWPTRLGGRGRLRLAIVLLLAVVAVGVTGGRAALSALADDETETATLSLAVSGDGSGRVTSVPSGIDCGQACTAEFDVGERVVLTAVAATGSAFAGWRGVDCPGVEACTLTLGSDASVTAVFDAVPLTRTLTVEVAGTGRGTVTSSPSGIDCGAACTAEVPDGTRVVLTATASPGSAFAGWRGVDCPGVEACTLTLGSDASVTAVFDAVPLTRTLAVGLAGAGRGTVTSTPSGIECGATCMADFAEGSRVVLTATAAPGSVFRGWQGGGCTGTDVCTLELRRQRRVVATFEPASVTHALTVGLAGAGRGTVTSSPSGIDCGAACTAAFADGSRVVLTATAAPGSVFTGWKANDCSGTGPCTVTMTEARSVAALFAVVMHELLVEVVGNDTGQGHVTSSPSGISCSTSCRALFPEGTRVTLTPISSESDKFGHWEGACAKAGPCTVTMSAARSVRAVFYYVPG